jgi:hypothetical protein
MSKRFQKVDVRLPAVAARGHARKLERQAPVDNFSIGSVILGKATQVSGCTSSEPAHLPSANSHTLATIAEQEHPKRTASTKASQGESSLSLAFTAADMCAQLEVLSRPIYQCDSMAAAPGTRFGGNCETGGSATSNHERNHLKPSYQASWQAARELASSALARLGSAGRNTNAKAVAQGHSDDSSSGHLSELFYLEKNEILLGNGVHGDPSAARGGHLLGSSSSFSAVMPSGEQQPLVELPAATPDRNAEVAVEVLDVWIDESDGTTGSSNSTGTAARDLLRLCSLAHCCTKSNDPCAFVAMLSNV